MESVTCNLCGSYSADSIYSLPDYLLDMKETHATYVRCQNCGLVYQNPRYTINEIGAFYPAEYDPYKPVITRRGFSQIGQYVSRIGLIKRRRFITRHKPNGGYLLDVGCAGGQFLDEIVHTPGWKVQGVEISPLMAKLAQEQFGLDVFTGTLEEAGFADESFDAVALWDVLEHLHDPMTSLQEIYRILKPGGIVALRVPNLDSWDANWFGKYWAGMDAPRHLYIFGQKTLAALLNKTGFTILERSCRLGSYPVFVLSVRFWLTARGVSKPRRQNIEKILLNPITALAMAPAFFISSVLLRGPSVTVIAVKRSSENTG